MRAYIGDLQTGAKFSYKENSPIHEVLRSQGGRHFGRVIAKDASGRYSLPADTLVWKRSSGVEE